MLKLFHFLTIVLLFTCKPSLADLSPKKMDHLIIGTGFHKRTYFHLGNTLCKALHVDVAYMRKRGRKHNILCSAPSSPASRTTLREVSAGNLDLGFTQGNRLNHAFLGKEFSENRAMKNLQVVAKTHREGFFIVRNPKVQNGIFDAGNVRGGASKLFLTLKKLGFLKKYHDLSLKFTGKAWDVANDFCSNKIQYMLFLDPKSYYVLDRVIDECGGRFEHIPMKELKQIIKQVPVLEIVNRDLYLPSYIVSHEKIGERLVYEFLRSMMKNSDLISKESLPYKELAKEANCSHFKFKGIQAPIHAGTKKLMKEILCK